MEDQVVDALYRREGATPQRGLRVSPTLLNRFAGFLATEAGALVALRSDTPADTAGAALPLSDTARACTAAAQALTAATAAMSERFADMEFAARGNLNQYGTTDEAFARQFLRMSELR